jgi:nucleotidyltransferase/DNA polymerase involved in DNA repair
VYCSSVTDRYKNLSAWLTPIKFSKINITNDAKLAIGALIVEEIRKDIFETLGYHCSAGICHNKVKL